MWAPGRRTAPSSPGASGGEPIVEEHAPTDLQGVTAQGGAGVVAQARPGAVNAAADIGAEQADRTGVGMADDPGPAQVEHPAGEPLGVQGWLFGVFELASGQADRSQACIPGEHAFLKKASSQLKADLRREVRHISLADPSPPKPQSMRIRVGREPATQDVADHDCPAGPGFTP